MIMQHPDSMQKLARAALIATSALVIIAATVWGIRLFTMSRNQTVAQSTNPANYALGGFPMTGNLAPDFTLTDQFGHQVTLSSLRGREVVLSFIDSRCKTLCPLTANIMYDARLRLGSSAASRVALVAVNANPAATSVAVVQAWSINHGMLHQWLFLTGTAQQLQSVYHLYNVYVQVSSNELVEHDPILFIIDAQGHERLYFETLDSNSKSDLSSEEVGLEAGMRQWLP
jgi:cytochrome oxidase Cu insertion factor (SCO1/SenC/PrrC family)